MRFVAVLRAVVYALARVFLVISFVAINMLGLRAVAESNGGFDLTLKAGGRTYPTGGIAEIEGGASKILWGNGRRTGTKYGYARIFAGGGGAGQYTEASAGAELFPISFLGVRAKTTWFENHDDYKDFNCVDSICRGEFRDDRLEAVVKLGVWRLFFLGNYAQVTTKLRARSPAYETVNVFVHPSVGLQMDVVRENKLFESRGVLGFRVTEDFFVSAMYLHFELDDLMVDADTNDTSSELFTGNIHWRRNGLHLFVGAGEFRSDLKSRGSTVVGGLSWSPWPDPGL